MIDSTHHIELDGTKYRLLLEGGDQPHSVAFEPLRPPNSVTVQGPSSQEFQARSDMLLWVWNDWSAGEGRRKLRFGEQGRSWHLNGVRAFEEPGHLVPGYGVEVCQDNTGAADFAIAAALAVGDGGTLVAFDKNSANHFNWLPASNKFGAASSSVTTNGAGDNAVGDENYLFWIERGTNNVIKWDGTTATKISDLTIGTGTTYIEQLGPYVYVYEPATAKVWEIPKTGATDGVLIDDWGEPGKVPTGRSCITTLNGRVYVMVTASDKTAIREITPSSAAGTGFGAEVSSYPGFIGDALWSHSGSLMTLGRYQTAAKNRTVLWDTPGGQYGSFGEVRDGDSMLVGSGGSGRMLDHFWVQEQIDASTARHVVMQIDSITGGVSCIAIDEVGDASGEEPTSVVVFDGDIFWSVDKDATTKRVMRARKDRYVSSSSAISPSHDFDLVGEKYLGSLMVATEPLPTDWIVYVDYQINGSGTWVNAITHSVTGATTAEVDVSTDTATVEFSSLQLRVRMVYGGAPLATSAPVVLGVEARAAVSKKVGVYNYLIDLTDDHSDGGQSYDGEKKSVALKATLGKTEVVDLKDGFLSRQANTYNQYDVTVDSGTILMDRPGEGFAAVTLREKV